MMEFHPAQLTAFTLAGAVALPSPFPASGPVSVVIVRDGDDHEVLVKILQVVSDRRIITRFIRPEDIRAIRAQPGGPRTSGPESWPVFSIRKLRGELDRRADELLARAERTGILDEAAWFHAAIVYVAESAPVLHRDEVGVTAAVSSEDVGFAGTLGGCCHVAAPTHGFPYGEPGLEALGVCCHVAEQPPPPQRWPGKERG